MKVVLFCSTYAPRRGGVETVTARLAREFRETGHEVVVFTNRYPRNLVAAETIDGIEVHRQLYPNMFFSWGSDEGPARLRRWTVQAMLCVLLPLTLLRLVRQMLRVTPDIVNIHYFSYPAMSMVAVAWLLRLPLVISFHGSDLPSTPYPAIPRWSINGARRVARAYTVCSVDLKRYARAALGNDRAPIVVAYNGIDPMARPRADCDLDQPAIVLVIARLVPKKGVEDAVQSLAIVRAHNESVRLMVVGDGPLRPELEALTCQLGLAEHVSMVGPLPPAEIAGLIQRARLVLIPSHWEAFGMVCLEAMVAGKPVVGYRVGGIPEIVLSGETGLLVESGDIEGLAAAQRLLLDNPKRAAALGRRGRERALSNFTWTRTAGCYLDTYAQALGASKIQGR